MICDLVVDCLGTILQVLQAYPDGSYNCPSCGYGVKASEPNCQNPACFTRPGYPPDVARKQLAEHATRKADEKRRQHDHETAIERAIQWHRDRSAQQATFIELAKTMGKCPKCALHYSKLVKHRGICPLAR